MYSKNRQLFFKISFWMLLLISLMGCKKKLPEYVAIPYSELPVVIDYNIHVKPILSDKCYLCHGPDGGTRKAGMRFDTENGLFDKTLKGNFPVKPGNLNKSEVINRILSDDLDYIMPPTDSHLTLNPREKAIIVKWVEQGAFWKKHWAFIPPEKSALPILDENWESENEIDLFVFEKLLENNLGANPSASKEQLLRRVTIDLTGLPPTIDEINSFLNDNSSEAYEKVVDRLLDSDSYAERMTLEWLDLARYSDSHGYHADGLRYMWPWRDWVINAFRENKPYDEFVTEQLAGDLLPNATKEQILATGFNRNHPMTAEGGAIDEEFRIDYVANRTNTFGTAFLGLTMECARCHDHKFDPISQEDYFKLFAFFNNNKELGMTADDGDFGPLMFISSEEEDKNIANINSKIDSLEQSIRPKKKEFANNIDFKKSDLFKPTKSVLHHSFEKTAKKEKIIYLDGNRSSKLGKDVELVNGMFGLAPKFDYQYDRIDLTGLEAFEIYDAFSISIWVNPDKRATEGKTMTIIGNSSGKPEVYKGWDLHLDADGYVSSLLISAIPNNYIQVKTKDTIPIGEWTHLLLTYDGSAKASGLHIYINGEDIPQFIEYDRLYKSMIPNRKGDLIVGKSPRGQTGDNGIYIGMLDQLTIYDTEILSSQVSSVYEQSKLGEEPIIWGPSEFDYLHQATALKNLYKDKLQIVDSIKEMMVMEEMKPQRKTYILERGEYDKPKEEVHRGTPPTILEFSSEYPKNRLGLSQWLFNKNNPLTARVTVNRYWQMIFGRGLVTTANDFGNQGASPTHAKLIDWLAIDFMESGWDVRKLIRKMVTSYTYKQSSIASKEIRELDPDNLLLARAPSYRRQAEFIRNNALISSGLYNNKVGGESVKPYQPEGLWLEKGNFSHYLKNYVQDHDEKQYRKSMYTFIKRTSPPPYLTIFDMPSRDICMITRERTNTPLQALILLNDPQFVEASRAMAYRMKTEGKDTLDAQISIGFQLTLSRMPSNRELEILSTLYNQEFEKFNLDINGAVEFLSVGDYRIPNQYNPSEMAAMTVVANTLFNMDEMYMKR